MKGEKGIQGDNSDVRCVSTCHKPAWHFDVKFANGEGHEMANVQKVTGHGHFLERKNSAYHCPHDLASNKVNDIYIVYKIRKYDRTGMEHNYIFSCGMGDNHHGICFLKSEKTMRVHGVAGKPPKMDIFRISLPVTIIHIKRIDGTLPV